MFEPKNPPVCVSFSSDAEVWEWEPGDMTRYRFALVHNASGGNSVFTHYDTRNNCAMVLPSYWRDAELEAGYIREKTRSNEYESHVYAAFLRAVASAHL